MPREVNENREKAFQLFKESRGKLTSKEIAEKLEENVNNITYWRKRDKWSKKLKGGAPIGNKNAVGNKGGGAPEGNLNGFKHGAYIPEDKFNSKKFLAKYLPAATEKIISDICESGLSTLDMLWSSILLKYTAILRSQKIMNVKSKKDITKELKKESWGKTDSKEYEIQFAWDKQERFLKAQSIAMKELSNMIKQYEELLHTNWEAASEEQKFRIDKIKCEIDRIKGNDNKDPIKIEFIKASDKNE